MTEKLDFDGMTDAAAMNEPPRNMTLDAPETVSETVKNGSETVSHPVDAADFAGMAITALDAGVSYAFGQGGNLTETEKNGFQSLFTRICDHFGLTAHMTGGWGLFWMGAGKILSVLFPRLADAEKRGHFVKTFFEAEENDLRTTPNGNDAAGDDDAGGDETAG